MHIKRGKVYAEAGKVLVDKSGRLRGLSAPAGSGEYTEAEAPLGEMRIDHGLGLAVWGGGTVACSIAAGADYAWYKTRLVKARYSNDDQIAVMLNGDAEEMRLMQEWRQWAAEAARAICRRLGTE